MNTELAETELTEKYKNLLSQKLKFKKINGKVFSCPIGIVQK